MTWVKVSQMISAPAWATGPISEVLSHYRANSKTVAGLEQTLSQLEAAAPAWSTQPAAYAEHYGLLADGYHMLFHQTHDGGALDRATFYLNKVAGQDGITGLVANRLELLGVQLEIAKASRDNGPAGMRAALREQCERLVKELADYAAPSLLGDLARNASRWAQIAVESDEWEGAADAYALAARAVDQLFRTVEIEQRGKVLFEFRGTVASAVSALGRAARWEDAVVTLEASRQRITRVLRGSRDLERLLLPHDPDLLRRAEADGAAWASAAGAYLRTKDPAAANKAREAARAAKERYLETLALVRQVPGLESYLVRPSYSEIRSAAAESPILYVSTSRYDTTLILLLPDGNLLATQLEHLTTNELIGILKDWSAALVGESRSSAGERRAALPLVGRMLEAQLVPAVKEILTQRFNEAPDGEGWRWGPVTLVVSGPMALIPFHVWTPMVLDDDGTKPRYIMPLMYSPSARQALAVRRPPRPTGSSRTLLSIADPEPRPSDLAPLKWARLESASIAQGARQSELLYGRDATAAAFEQNAPKCEVLHLACHARTSPGAATQGRLELADGPMSGAEILDRLVLDHVAVVVLSACRTGQQDPFLPDESLDLGSMFLAAGARAVVANMWPVNDLAAALFVWRMFQAWDWGEGVALPAAVNHSALWLRDLEVAELSMLADNYPGWRRAIQPYMRDRPHDARLFAEPYYWAAFSYGGG